MTEEDRNERQILQILSQILHRVNVWMENHEATGLELAGLTGELLQAHKVSVNRIHRIKVLAVRFESRSD